MSKENLSGKPTSTKSELGSQDCLRPKVVVSKDVLDQIKYLCMSIKKDEWSGVLFYTVEGSVKDIANMTMHLHQIFPMDKGTSTFTAYDYGDPALVEHMMANEDLCEMKIGHIHSHNTMKVFFSGTDMEELHDNVKNHNYYLSFIVNNFMEFIAKLVFVGKTTVEQVSYTCKDDNGDDYQIPGEPITKEKFFNLDCDILTPENYINVPDFFRHRTTKIIDMATQKQAKKEVDAKFIEKYKTDDTRTPAYVPKNLRSTGKEKNVRFNSGGGWGKGEFQGGEVNGKDVEVIEDAEYEPIPSEHTFFTAHVLRLGNPPDPNTVEDDPIIDAVEELELSKVNGNFLATTIVENFSAYYNSFFHEPDYNKFAEILADVIDEIALGIEDHPILKPIHSALESYMAELMKEVSM